MEEAPGHHRLNPEVWGEIFAHVPFPWQALCCRVCKAWQHDLEQQGEDIILVDYGLVTLCSVLATEGVDEVMRRIRLHCPSGVAADLGRMDQVRRFVQRYRCSPKVETVDEWMQLASQEPDAGWLCTGMSKTKLVGRGMSLMRQEVGKPQEFSKVLGVLGGHSDNVRYVTYSPDGNTIASGGADVNVRLWDAKTMEHKCTLTGHSDHVSCVAYSPDNKSLASACRNGTVQMWDLSGEMPVEKGTLRGHSEDNPECTCNHDAGEDGTHSPPALRKDKYEANPECPVKGHWANVRCVAWSPDGEFIASASEDETVCLWSKSGKFEGILKGHSDYVTCVAYSPDGKHIASASSDKTVKIWDAETKQEVRSLMGHTKDNPECRCGESHQYSPLAWSPDGEVLASGLCCVDLWSKSGERIGTLIGDTRLLTVTCLSYSPDGKHIASVSKDSKVKIWDAVKMEEAGSLTGECVAFSPCSKAIASAAGNAVRLWNVETMEEMPPLKLECLGMLLSCSSVVWSPDGKVIACGDCRGTVRLWTTQDEHNGTHTRKVHSEAVRFVTHSPDGKLIASAGFDNTVKVWDAETKQVLFQRGHSKGHPDCTCNFKTGLFQNEYEANPQCPVNGHIAKVNSVAFSPDSKFVASGSGQDPSCLPEGMDDVFGGTVHDNSIRIWDISTGVEVCSLTGLSEQVRCVIYSPDGNTIASCSASKSVCLWDAKSLEDKGELTGHSRSVLCIAYSPDGQYIASGSDDSEIKIWDSEMGHEVWSQPAHLRRVASVAYSPDGSTIASSSLTESLEFDAEPVRLWDAGTMELKDAVKGNFASWQKLANGRGQFIVTTQRNMVYVHRTDSDREQQGAPLACFCCPWLVRSVSCRGTKVIVGCSTGEVLFLEAPLFAEPEPGERVVH